MGNLIGSCSLVVTQVDRVEGEPLSTRPAAYFSAWRILHHIATLGPQIAGIEWDGSWGPMNIYISHVSL